MMSIKKIFGLSLVGAMSLALAACGGKDDPAPAPIQPGMPGYPYPNGQYPTQVGYNCPNGGIQLRTPMGYPQCFSPMVDLASACNQVRGMMVQGGLCRVERRIQGRSFRWSTYDIRDLFRSNRRRNRYSYDTYGSGFYRPIRLAIPVALFPGESLKVSGRIDSAYGWSATLLRGMMAVGSSSNDMTVYSNGDNFTISEMGSGVYPQQYGYPQPYGTQPVAGQCYASATTACQAGYYYTNAQCCPNGQVGGTYGYSMPQTPSYQQYALEILSESDDGFDVEFRTSAISCSDGRGNNYPCM